MARRLLEWLRRMGASQTAAGARSDAGGAAGSAPGANPPPEPAESPAQRQARTQQLYALAKELTDVFQVVAHPRDLRQDGRYREALGLLAQGPYTPRELCTFATGDNSVLNCVALDALRERPGTAGCADELLAGTGEMSVWAAWILCEWLEEQHPAPILERFVKRLPGRWQSLLARQTLASFLARRLARGERIEPAWLQEADPEDEDFDRGAFLLSVLETVPGPAAEEAVRTLRQGHRSERDAAKLRAFAQVGPGAGPPIHPHAALERALEAAEATCLGGRSLLVVGRPGTGRATLVRAVTQRLEARGFLVMEASASDLLAGQSHMGQLEGRLKSLLEVAARTRLAWSVPGFVELVHAGRHTHDPIGVLEKLLPQLEARRLVLLGTLEPEGLERLLRMQPRLRQVVEVVKLAELGAAETLALARAWAAPAEPGGAPKASEQVLREALELAQGFLGATAAPGNLLGLVKSAHEARARAGGGPLELPDLLEALARTTGLPLALLDERALLDLDALRRLFQRRVLGQEEAVECLVERVAMLKAGLVDPGRPAGVFLFTGPTGTGKTEIARTLAEFLFGSPERLVRVDMSELTGPQAKARLLGSPNELDNAQALVHRLREQPFAVVLLDEFEKADPEIWDVFLQVFDAGRLTDAQGRTADCRQAIFVLTSNAGAERVAGARVGFGAAPVAAGPEAVLAELVRLFRPEFLNRLDRVVVFRPLSRAVMREVLAKELERVLSLRGLRTRQWIIEWDESALDFLLEKGFSPTLGARPLRRAVERWVLAPLATTIVKREAPSGDQFLFMRSDGRAIEVVFVDPDAPEPERAAELAPVPAPAAAGLDLGTLALDGHGGAAEVAFLRQAFERLAGEVGAEPWSATRATLLAQLEERGFWERPERFATLSEIEYRERIEHGLASARRVLERLAGPSQASGRDRRGAPRAAYPEVVRPLAQQLYLLEAATQTLALGRPRDAFLSVEALADGPLQPPAEAFARRLAEMYRSWAARRRMRLEELEQRDGSETWRWTAAISGYGAFLLLEAEAGWHVLEREEGGETRRQRVRVRLAPQPEHPLGDAPAAARAALARDASADPRIVRRYREAPSPLVRDAVRGWRTGRIERVWAGDFDLVR
ncbi:MAG TPA: AAA family ATPase [Planctomycetota bacterium]